MNLLHRVVDPIKILPIKRNYIYRINKLNFRKSKTFCLVTSDSTWNDDFINSVNKLRKSDIGVEAGLIEQTIVVFNRYDDFDKIQAKKLEMKSSLDSLDIRPGWKREAKTTLDGIISFCKLFFTY